MKADDLLDMLMHNAGREVAARNPELSNSERERIARMIGIAAVRYFLIKFSRSKIVAFDLEEALSFEGESGPYIQYAVVRANNIFQKLQQRDSLDERALLDSLKGRPAAELAGENGSHELWRWCWMPPVSTRSSTRSSDRWSSRCSRSTPSPSRRRSTHSTIAPRSSTRNAMTCGGGARGR